MKALEAHGIEKPYSQLEVRLRRSSDGEDGV